MKQTIRECLLELQHELQAGIDFEVLAMVNSNQAGTLSFIDDERFLDSLLQNNAIQGVITNESLAAKITTKYVLVHPDPRWFFYTLHNLVASKQPQFPTEIHPNARVHPTASIASYNVVIGDGCVIGPHAAIAHNVQLEQRVIVQAGVCLGNEGFEHKRTAQGMLSVVHDGKLIIKPDVVIGANSTIAKGFAYRDTILGTQTKLDAQVYVAHCVHIGERCLLAGQCAVMGSVTVGNDVWIGPNAVVSSGLSIGSRAFITLGSTVTKHVAEGVKVSGNFAIEHQQFLSILKKNINEL